MTSLTHIGGAPFFNARSSIRAVPSQTAARCQHPATGFTLVEVLISMSLALMVMAAMMSTFLYLGRNLHRLANQNQLETAARLMLSQFARDVRQAEAASLYSDATPTNPPTDSAVKLWNIPLSGGTFTNVTYNFDSVTHTLTRSDSASGTSSLALKYIQSFDLNYYNSWGLPQASNTSPYQSSVPNVLSIKCVEVRFTTRMGDMASNTSGFMTPLYSAVSSRLFLRNRTLPE